MMYREASALFGLQEWYSSVKRGDHDGIRSKLFSEHPGYSADAPTSIEELRTQINRGAERIKHSAMVVARDGRYVLLVKHTESSDNLTGIYGLPASEIYYSETETEAASRSFTDRTGLSCNDTDMERLPNLYYAVIPQKQGGRQYSGVSFACDNFDGNLKESEKTEPV
jgi:hypothetical protein